MINWNVIPNLIPHFINILLSIPKMICCHYKIHVVNPCVRFIILLLMCLLLFLYWRQYISDTPTRIILLKQKGYPMQATRNSENIDTRLRVFPFCKDVKNRKQEVIFFCRNFIWSTLRRQLKKCALIIYIVFSILESCNKNG